MSCFHTNWYRKDTWSGRYLNFFAYTSLSYKKSVINAMVDRAILLSDSNFHKSNLQLIENTLVGNNYPINFVKSNISKRLHFLDSRSNIINNNTNLNISQLTHSNITHNIPNNHQHPQKKYLKLPYIDSCAHSITNCLKFFNITPAWATYISTKCLFTRLKDVDNKLMQSGLVYKISCLNCTDPPSCYYGETIQHLNKRTKQHKYHITLGDSKHSKLCEHSISTGHIFDFENSEIMHSCNNRRKRLIQESLYISTNPYSINYRNDVNGISNYYCHIL
jgi:hypothetical protein